MLGTAAGLLVVSLLILLWARTRPGFDPYGWLVWGRQTVAGNLNTNAAPSWKPLPYLFTAPYGLFGHYQLWLWMVTSLAVSLAGAVFAGRIAYRLTARDSDRRYAAYAAAGFAGLGYFGISSYWHYMLSAQSDPMIVALCLAAIDCHLCGRYRWAWVLGALASLGRPEVWLFLGLYSIWAWLRVPSMRWLIGERDRAAGRDVVRDPGADLAQPVRGRVERARIRSPAPQRPGVRHDRPLSGPQPGGDRADRAGGGGDRAVARGIA